MIFILKNLLNFIKKNTAIFVVLLLVEVVTLLGVFTAYNYYLENTETNKKYYHEKRTFSVQLLDTDNLEENINKVLNSGYEIDHIYAIISPYSLNLTKNKAESYFLPDGTVKEKVPDLFYADYYGESFLKHRVLYGSGFSKSDNQNAENKIVLSFNLSQSYNIGDEYIINNIGYEVIGIGTQTINYIPYNTVIKENIPISGLGISLKNEVDADTAKEFSCLLTDIFGTNNVNLPSGEYGDEIEEYNKYIIFTWLMLFLSIFNFVYLYSYILNKRKKQYSILRIFGCTKLNGITMYTIEALIISISSYLISVVLYLFVCTPIMKLIDKYTIFAMDINSFLLVFIVFILVMLCIVIPSIINYSKKDIVDQYRN